MYLFIPLFFFGPLRCCYDIYQQLILAVLAEFAMRYNFYFPVTLGFLLASYFALTIFLDYSLFILLSYYEHRCLYGDTVPYKVPQLPPTCVFIIFMAFLLVLFHELVCQLSGWEGFVTYSMLQAAGFVS